MARRITPSSSLPSRSAAIKLQPLLPYVQSYLSSRPSAQGTEQHLQDGVWSACGVQVHLGRCPLLAAEALDSPKFSEVAFMPFLNVRGPNGLWVIRRGVNHPLRKFSDKFCGWVEHCEGRPIGSSLGSIERHGTADSLYVFQNEADYQDYREAFPSDPADDDSTGDLRYLKGDAFLAALAGFDGIEVWHFGISFWDCERILGTDWEGEDIRGAELPQRLAAALA